MNSCLNFDSIIVGKQRLKLIFPDYCPIPRQLSFITALGLFGEIRSTKIYDTICLNMTDGGVQVVLGSYLHGSSNVSCPLNYSLMTYWELIRFLNLCVIWNHDVDWKVSGF